MRLPLSTLAAQVWRPLAIATLTIATLPLSACGEDLRDRLPAPRTVRDPGPTPEQLFVVFVTGDEEYRSEESMPLLADILERDFGFRTSVCYAIDTSGQIDPNRLDHIEGLEQLTEADLVVWFTRFRQLPEEQVQLLRDYTARGGPLVGFRTSTHPFRYPDDHPLADEWNEKWPARVFGQRWITHHGHFEDGRDFLTDVTLTGPEDHPILRGVEPFQAWSWLYHVEGGGDSISGEPVKLLTGRTLRSNHADRHDRFPAENPVAWTKEHDEGENPARVFFTTLGHPYDFRQESMRRLALQGILWALGLEEEIPETGVRADPTYAWYPPNSGFGDKYRKHVYPYAERRGGPGRIDVEDEDTIAYIGFEFGAPENAIRGRELEAALHAAFPKKALQFRSPSGVSRPEKGWAPDLDAWLRQLAPDTILVDHQGYWSYPDGLQRNQRVVHSQLRNLLRTSFDGGARAPQVILISPRGVPVQTGSEMTEQARNMNRVFADYSKSLEQIARRLGIAYVDHFTPTVTHDWRPLIDQAGTLDEDLFEAQYALWLLGLLGCDPEVVIPDALLEAITAKNQILTQWSEATTEVEQLKLKAKLLSADEKIHQLVR